MEFRTAYLQAMRASNPQEFNRLTRSGQMEAHLQAKTQEAYQMLDDLLVGVPRAANGAPRDVRAVHEAERQVIETLTEFPRAPTTE